MARAWRGVPLVRLMIVLLRRGGSESEEEGGRVWRMEVREA
jgi:hypothetical protein